MYKPFYSVSEVEGTFCQCLLCLNIINLDSSVNDDTMSADDYKVNIRDPYEPSYFFNLSLSFKENFQNFQKM